MTLNDLGLLLHTLKIHVLFGARHEKLNEDKIHTVSGKMQPNGYSFWQC